jgi:hypothetical protein
MRCYAGTADAYSGDSGKVASSDGEIEILVECSRQDVARRTEWRCGGCAASGKMGIVMSHDHADGMPQKTTNAIL